MRITDAQRRHHLVARQLSLGGHSASQVAERMVALHATDPSSVPLAILARAPELCLSDVTDALDDGSLVRVLAMRRTLFVARHRDVAMLHAAASMEVGRKLRARMLAELTRLPTDPVVSDPDAFLAHAEHHVLAELSRSGPLDGAALARAVPALRTAFLPSTTKKWDVRRTITSPFLSMLSAEGTIVRGQPAGSWTSNRHRWERATDRFDGGIPARDENEARTELAHAWLAAFGPATLADLAWWTGWPLGRARAIVEAIDTVPVALTHGDAVMLADTDLDTSPSDGHIALLPALDPTTMGWKHRDWYLGEHRPRLFDTMGNAGPTIWVDGKIVGGWAVRDGGEIAYRVFEDIGSHALAAVDAEAARLTAHLAGASFRAAFPTPTYRELYGAAAREQSGKPRAARGLAVE